MTPVRYFTLFIFVPSFFQLKKNTLILFLPQCKKFFLTQIFKLWSTATPKQKIKNKDTFKT